LDKFSQNKTGLVAVLEGAATRWHLQEVGHHWLSDAGGGLVVVRYVESNRRHSLPFHLMTFIKCQSKHC